MQVKLFNWDHQCNHHFFILYVDVCQTILSNLLVQSDALCIHLQDNFGFVSSYMTFFGKRVSCYEMELNFRLICFTTSKYRHLLLNGRTDWWLLIQGAQLWEDHKGL